MPASWHAAADLLGRDVDLDAERRQHVGRARARRQRAIAVLGDGHAGAGDDEGGAGRDVDRAGAVAAGADHVDGVGGSLDAQHLGAHRRHRAGDLVDGFAAHPQRHQQSAHLRGRGLAGHHAVEGGCRLVARQRRAGGDFSDDRFEVVHRVLSEDAGGACAVSNQDAIRRAAKAVSDEDSVRPSDHAQLFAPVTCAKAA